MGRGFLPISHEVKVNNKMFAARRQKKKAVIQRRIFPAPILKIVAFEKSIATVFIFIGGT
jgi:hypothetical protein